VKLPLAGEWIDFVMTSILTALDRTARQALRLMALPLLQAPEEALMGRQAVLEGVLMR